MVEYPIIEPGVVIEWKRPADGSPVEDTVEILGMHANEDGDVQLKINETANDAPDGPRSVHLDDLHKQLRWRDYEVIEKT